MKSSLIVSLVALVLGAVALVTALVKPPSAATPEAAPIFVPDGAADAGLTVRVEALAEENRALRDRLAMLELRPAPTQRLPAAEGLVSQEQFDGFRDEVREALASLGAPAVEIDQPDAFKEQVATTLSEIRKGEAVTAARKNLEKRSAGLDSTMRKVDAWLELTPQQSDAMRSALLTHYGREAELVRLWEAGVDGELLGGQKASDRDAFRDELSLFLTPGQLTTFWNRGVAKED